MSYSVSHSSRIWDLAAVCWELIDSASPRAKGPAMVLSLCPACSGAGGGWTGTRGPGGEDGGLARGHGAKRGGGGGRFGWGDGQMPEQQPALEVTPPPPTAHQQPQPQTIRWRAWRDPLRRRSIPVSLIQLACKLEACRQPKSYFWIYFPSPVEWNFVEMEQGRCLSSSSVILLETTVKINL